MDDGAGGSERLRVSVQSEAGEFRHAELFFENALRVVVLEGPVINATFDSSGPVE